MLQTAISATTSQAKINLNEKKEDGVAVADTITLALPPLAPKRSRNTDIYSTPQHEPVRAKAKL